MRIGRATSAWGGLALLGTLAAALLAPDLAAAHGFQGRADLPIPRWLFAWGAFVVLVVSFVALATLWPKPKLEPEQVQEKQVLSTPRVLEPILGAIGIAIFAVVVYSGFAGSQTTNANLAPTFVFVVFWVGLAFLSLLLGDVFAAFNPWRAFGRGVGWLVGRVGSAPAPIPYPERLGRWPAALGILAFTVLELVVPGSSRDDPSTLATYALVYAAIQLVGMSVYGSERWTRNADGLAVYFHLLSRVSPLHWSQGRLRLRPILAGTTGLALVPGTVAVLVVMIGTVSYDGFSQGPTWRDLGPEVQDLFVDLGMSLGTALSWASFVGLLAMVGAIGLLYRLGVVGIRSVDRKYGTSDLQRRFVHSLIPIALAYVVAHYFSYLLTSGSNMAFLVSDPLGDGANLFGTASVVPNTNWLTNEAVWYVQVGALVLGHVGGLCLAHDRALTLYSDVRVATRSQYWMLAVMVAFTSLGLWLLSAQGT